MSIPSPVVELGFGTELTGKENQTLVLKVQQVLLVDLKVIRVLKDFKVLRLLKVFRVNKDLKAYKELLPVILLLRVLKVL